MSSDQTSDALLREMIALQRETLEELRRLRRVLESSPPQHARAQPQTPAQATGESGSDILQGLVNRNRKRQFDQEAPPTWPGQGGRRRS